MLDVIFKKDTPFVEEMLADNLFLSIDKVSALRHDYKKVLNNLKVYDDLEIINEDIIEMEEHYDEKLFIFKAINSGKELYFFTRIVTVRGAFSDILVYTLGDTLENSKGNIEYYKKIFFKPRVKVSDEFISFFNSIKETKVAFSFENERFKMHHETQEFLDLIKYEDWDYKNEFQNYLDFVMNPKTIEEIKENLGKDTELSIVIDRHTENVVYKFNCKLINKEMDGMKLYFLVVKK